MQQRTVEVEEPVFTLELLSSEEESTDGRVARGQRTRRRVAEALVSLLSEGDPDPSAKLIAQRAGVCLRLVFHHFADMDDLYRTVASLQLEAHWRELPALPPELPLETRIARTVEHRSTLYEEISPVRRATVRRSGNSAKMTATIACSNTLLSQNLSAAFAPELDSRPMDEGCDLLAAMDAASSWESWERLRHASDLPVDTASRVMARTLTALLA